MNTNDYRAGWLACREAATRYLECEWELDRPARGHSTSHGDRVRKMVAGICALEPAEPTPEWESESCGTCGGDDLPCKSDGIVWTCRDCLAPAEPTPRDVAFYRVGQTGAERALPVADVPAEPRYPCEDCGALRTKAEGGTTFTVCDACWDKHHPPAAEPEACARCYGVSLIRDGSDGSRECPDCGGTGRAR